MVSSNKILPKTNLASVSTFLYLFIIFMLFGIFFYFAKPIYGKYIEVAITAVGDKNSKSHGTEVWILSLYDNQNPTILIEKNKGWLIPPANKNAVMTFGNTKSVFSFKGEVKENIIVRLLKHPWSGFVEVTVNGETKIYDLYSEKSHDYLISLNSYDVNNSWLFINIFFNIKLLICILIILYLINYEISNDKSKFILYKKPFCYINFYLLFSFISSINIIPLSIIENNINFWEQVSFYTDKYLNSNLFSSLFSYDSAGYIQPFNIFISYILLYFSPIEQWQGLLSYGTLCICMFVNSLICLKIFRSILSSDTSRMFFSILINIFIMTTEAYFIYNTAYCLCIFSFLYILVEKKDIPAIYYIALTLLVSSIIASKGQYITYIFLYIILIIYKYMIVIDKKNFWCCYKKDIIFFLILCIISTYNFYGMYHAENFPRKTFTLSILQIKNFIIYYINFIYILFTKNFSIKETKLFHPYLIILSIIVFFIVNSTKNQFIPKEKFFTIILLLGTMTIFSLFSFYINVVGPDFLYKEGYMEMLRYTSDKSIFNIPTSLLNQRRYIVPSLFFIMIFFVYLDSLYTNKLKIITLSISLFIFFVPSYIYISIPRNSFIGIWDYTYKYIYKNSYYIPSFSDGGGIWHNCSLIKINECVLNKMYRFEKNNDIVSIIVERTTENSIFPIALEIVDAYTEKKYIIFSDYPEWYKYQYFGIYRKISSMKIIPLREHTEEFKARLSLAHSYN